MMTSTFIPFSRLAAPLDMFPPPAPDASAAALPAKIIDLEFELLTQLRNARRERDRDDFQAMRHHVLRASLAPIPARLPLRARMRLLARRDREVLALARLWAESRGAEAAR